MRSHTRPYSGLSAPHPHQLTLRRYRSTAAAAAARSGSSSIPCSTMLHDTHQRCSGDCSTSSRPAGYLSHTAHARASSSSGACGPLQRPRRSPCALPCRSAAACSARARGTDAAAADGAPQALLPPDPPPIFIVEDGKDEQGQPVYQQLDPDLLTEFEPAFATDDLIEELDGVDLDLGGAGGGEAGRAAAVGDEEVEVPAVRLVDDPQELELIGDGLPVIHGVRYQTSFVNHELTRRKFGICFFMNAFVLCCPVRSARRAEHA